MGSDFRVLRNIVFGVVVFVGVIWLLYVEILTNHATTTLARITVPSTGSLEHWKLGGRERHPTHHWKLTGRQRHPIHHDFHLNYVSKRRVPNGPDPIHNRRASKSREPPGRS